jgi:hypothetical protein
MNRCNIETHHLGRGVRNHTTKLASLNPQRRYLPHSVITSWRYDYVLSPTSFIPSWTNPTNPASSLTPAHSNLVDGCGVHKPINLSREITGRELSFSSPTMPQQTHGLRAAMWQNMSILRMADDT